MTLVRNVLIVVADEEMGAEWYRRVTEAPDLRCDGVASSLADGVDLLRPGAVDAIVLSDALPDAGVWNSVRAFRDLDPGASVIVVSTGPTVETLREARWAGAIALITDETPFDDVRILIEGHWSGRMMVDADAALEILGSAPSGAVSEPGGVLTDTMPLTPREREVLLLLGRGLDPTNIARELGLSIHTARGHVKRILAKLGAHSQLEAVIIAVQLGFLPQFGRN